MGVDDWPVRSAHSWTRRPGTTGVLTRDGAGNVSRRSTGRSSPARWYCSIARSTDGAILGDEPVDGDDGVGMAVVVPGHRAVAWVDEPSRLNLVQVHAQALEHAQESPLDHGEPAPDAQRPHVLGDGLDQTERGQ